MTTDHPFYVYLLLTTPTDDLSLRERFEPMNVLYVGKGKGYRWASHFKDALSATEQPALSDKHRAIRESLGENPSAQRIEQHALVVAGGLTEAEAFRLEAIMMHLVGGVTATANLVSGHSADELLVPARDARVFFGAADLKLDLWQVNGTGHLQSELVTSETNGSIVFMVKGTDKALAESDWNALSVTGRFPNSVVMNQGREASEKRRGWNPQVPWTDEEAWSRARRYWSGAPTSIALWQRLIAERDGYLALLVPDHRDHRSVIRYVWELSSTEPWEDYDAIKKFGFPTGRLVVDHPWLGKRPVDDRGRGILRSPNAPAVTICASQATTGGEFIGDSPR